MNTERLLTALLLQHAKNSGDSETYETILDSEEDKVLLLGNIELSNILLKIAAKARGISDDQMLDILMITTFDTLNMSKE